MTRTPEERLLAFVCAHANTIEAQGRGFEWARARLRRLLREVKRAEREYAAIRARSALIKAGVDADQRIVAWDAIVGGK